MRTTSDPKEQTVKLRLNDEMRKHVEKESRKKGQCMSEYIRELIERDMRSSLVSKNERLKDKISS